MQQTTARHNVQPSVNAGAYKHVMDRLTFRAPALFCNSLSETKASEMLKNTLTPLAIAALALVSAGSALAESQYGYSSAGTGTITATAKVTLKVTVPKLILLRIGASNASVPTDDLIWATGFSIPGASTTPANGNDQLVDWSGAAPTATVTPSSNNPITVYAWTNAATGSINCAAPTWAPAAGGPTNADFAVTVTGTLPHPGPNLSACASTNFPSNTVATGTWKYVLGGSPASWQAGAYTTTVTYTAQGI